MQHSTASCNSYSQQCKRLYPLQLVFTYFSYLRSVVFSDSTTFKDLKNMRRVLRRHVSNIISILLGYSYNADSVPVGCSRKYKPPTKQQHLLAFWTCLLTTGCLNSYEVLCEHGTVFAQFLRHTRICNKYTYC